MTDAESPIKQSNKKKVATGAALALSGALVVAGTMAYFTDRQDASASATAGSVDISVTENWQDIDNFNPGDIQGLNYEIANIGNKSVDVRETLVVKSSVPMTDGEQLEFEIYNRGDVTQNAAGAYVPNEGVSPIATGGNRVVSDDGTTVKYIIDEYVLNGTGAAAETEAGINATSKEMDYVLVFSDEAQNKFQSAEATVELLAEAKQHRNTDSDSWSTVSTESVTIGGETVNAVPAR